MAGFTLGTAQTHLDAWLAADQAVATGQSYEIAGRRLTRANAEEIRKNIDYWNSWVVRLSRGGGIRMRIGIPS